MAPRSGAKREKGILPLSFLPVLTAAGSFLPSILESRSLPLTSLGTEETKERVVWHPGNKNGEKKHRLDFFLQICSWGIQLAGLPPPEEESAEWDIVFEKKEG